MKERLQKIIRDAGYASRREAEQWILEGRVMINGEIVKDLGVQADPDCDLILIDHLPIQKEKKVYYLFNKPSQVMTTRKDPQGRRTIMDFFSQVEERLFPVGRLDFDTEGLVLLTNDGAMMNGLLHPSKEIEKRYRCRVQGAFTEEDRLKLEKGVMLSDGLTAPAHCKILERNVKDQTSLIELEIHEGKNRQVRRMLAALGYLVISLRRVRFSFLTLEGVPLGKYRPLTEAEIQKLKTLFERSSL